ncbi:MAG: PrsW family intramembrane metalloprotease [Crocinitomicaceae bacterium]|nr:PrsW family intramembrane metalloprotease [Crocinitomicaceae bacterium]
MLTALLLLIFIVFLATRVSKAPGSKGKSFLFRYRMGFILLGITVLPALYINFSDQKGTKNNNESYLEFLLEDRDDHGFETIERFYLKVMAKHPDSVRLRIEYIDFLMVSDTYGSEEYESTDLLETTYSANKNVDKRAHSYLRAEYYYNNDEWTDIPLSSTTADLAYDNFFLGAEARHTGRFKEAKAFFLKEIEINPNFDRVYYELIELCRARFPKDFDKYSLDDKFASHLPYSVQRYNFFWHGHHYSYIKAIMRNAFTDVDPIAFLAALLISIVWLVFMRSMDVYNKEKWRDIIIVFILGVLFTNLCYYGYDSAQFIFDFRINGEAWNDFWYCTIVIGGSEELVKLIPWVAFIFLAKKAKEPYDYLLYASISALGFAFAENLTYLERPGNIMVRSIMSTVGHMFDASIVAYSFIIARYKTKNKAMKIAWPIIGFVLAALSHGFYDFWLISSAVSEWFFLTTIFFIITLHLWFVLHNNAINNSPFYTKSIFNSDVQLNLITVGIIGVMMFEYVIIGYYYGTDAANHRIGSKGWMIVIFLSYMTAILASVKIIPGRWKKYKLVMPTGVGSFFRLNAPRKFDSQDSDEEAHVGLNLKIFVSKSNRYVSDKFPVSGICTDEITLSETKGWYLFQLNNTISYPGFKGDQVIIRVKDRENSLEEDKVEIILLFIPVGYYIRGSTMKVEDFRFTGKAFARPNN